MLIATRHPCKHRLTEVKQNDMHLRKPHYDEFVAKPNIPAVHVVWFLTKQSA